MIEGKAYVDAPEFLDGVECNNLLEKIIPVVTLFPVSCQYRIADDIGSRPEGASRTFPEAGFVNHRVQSWASGCLTVKLSLSSKTVTTLSEEVAASVDVEASLPPSGEMGMVDKSTCSDILTDS